MEDEQSNIRFRDIAPAVELVCWIVVLLAPLLRLVNGAAVTGDQLMIQVTIFSIAGAGAIGMRIYNFRR